MVLGGRANVCIGSEDEEDMIASHHSELKPVDGLLPAGMSEAYPDPMVKIGSVSPMPRGASPVAGMKGMTEIGVGMLGIDGKK